MMWGKFFMLVVIVGEIIVKILLNYCVGSLDEVIMDMCVILVDEFCIIMV